MLSDDDDEFISIVDKQFADVNRVHADLMEYPISIATRILQSGFLVL